MKSEAPPPIQIKAERDGFVLLPNPMEPLQEILDYMDERLTSSREFFANAKMALDLRERPFRAEEIAALRRLLEEKASIKLVEVRVGENPDFVFAWVSQQLGVPVKRTKDAASSEDKPHPVIVRSTCRSGVRIESPAECVILGDVNPGAEILAAGDIIIFGNLKGMAHAGAFGNRSARIWARSIEPNQIRIADLVAVPPKGDTHTPKRYEVAEIQGDRIEVITA